MDTVLFVSATIGFSENLFLVKLILCSCVLLVFINRIYLQTLLCLSDSAQCMRS